MKFSRDAWLAIGLLSTLIVIMSFVAFGQQSKDQNQKLPALTSLSSAPDGTLALKLWLQQINYTVLEDVISLYQLPKSAKIILVLQPSFFQPDELKVLDNWVKAGGTLIAAGDSYGMFDLENHFDFDAKLFDQPPQRISVGTPLFTNPKIDTTIPLPASGFPDLSYYLISTRPSYLPYLVASNQPVLVSFDLGKGRVILSSTAYAFSNIGLKQAGNPELVLNLLGLARVKGPVWFDEWHHGIQGAADAVGPENWLRNTPLGRSVLFVVLVIFLALVFQGRGFGRPVPLPHELKRRGALEHVTAMANLSRLAGHRQAVLKQYHHELKRTLGRRYRLDPSLPDAEYVATLTRYNPAVDGPALSSLLNRLQQKNLSESEMVKAATDAAKWIKE